MPCAHIVPVTFLGGTGGHFLASFITAAKHNIQGVMNLSKYGNAHLSDLIEIEASSKFYPHNVSDMAIIEAILDTDLNPKFPDVKPWFTKEHIYDLDLVNQYFEKSIRITYDTDDILDIAWLRLRKTNDGDIDYKSLMFSKAKRYVRQNQHIFINHPNISNVLFVSWKELFKGNVNELITKLSIFTDIDAANFSIESLIHWRDKTQYCIDSFTQT